MKVYFLDENIPSLLPGRDPRRLSLYGPDVTCLVQDDASLAKVDSCQGQVIGPFWAPGPRWSGGKTTAPDLAQRITEYRRRRSDGVLVVGDYYLAEALIPTDLAFVFDPNDSFALFHRRRARHLWSSQPLKALNSLRLARSFGIKERRLATRAAAVVITGQADEAHLRRLSPSAHVLRIGNGTSQIATPPVTPADDGRTLGFHGALRWEPNQTTAERLAGPIARALAKAEGPPVRLRIAGMPVEPTLMAANGRNGVEICGFVEDLRAWMASLSLYIMPMYQGAGLKNKLLEAMAMGLPVLTNELGAEALDAEGRACIAIARSDHELVRMVWELLERPDRLAQLRLTARHYAERHFDWAWHRRALQDELGKLMNAGRL